MKDARWTEVDRYIADMLVGRDDALEAAARDADAAGLPSIAVTPNLGKLLMLLVRMCGARRILEIGTLGGYSAIWMAKALPADGRIVTLEIDPKHAAIASANVARAGFANIVDVRVGRAIDTLPVLAAEGNAPFDFVFIDADKPSNPDYFTWALKLTRPGSVIVVDNVVRDGAVVDATSTDPSVRGVRRLNEMLAAEPRVSATALQTVGAKGYDGFIMAVVTGG